MSANQGSPFYTNGNQNGKSRMNMFIMLICGILSLVLIGIFAKHLWYDDNTTVTSDGIEQTVYQTSDMFGLAASLLLMAGLVSLYVSTM